MVFWLRQGQRDGGAQEVEGLALDAGRFGEHREGDLGAGEADLVAVKVARWSSRLRKLR
jgi:hypothetical protein